MESKTEEVERLRRVAVETAVSAGKLAREMWTKPREISYKGFRDLVTDADIATQKQITQTIQARFPNHGFLTEEEDSDLPEAGPIIWIIDPIDGTTNYSRKIPEFCVSVAACLPIAEGYQPIAAAIYDPMRDELFSAAQGQGATLQLGNQTPQTLQVSQVSDLSEVVFALDWSSASQTRTDALQILNRFAEKSYTVRTIGTAALAMAWVAAGRIDFYFNLHLRPWDVAAAMLLVQESGGAVAAPDGSPLVWDVNGIACVMSNGRLAIKLE
ncbi:inositol monophosphatase family protein [Candidatus Leptofilum sp.]|uniref:inositol monophosphatase family protein n=1 Tax=Candidatus Leptofilum sp. TaxID=3241576 RepID=UPI003B5AE288